MSNFTDSIKVVSDEWIEYVYLSNDKISLAGCGRPRLSFVKKAYTPKNEKAKLADTHILLEIMSKCAGKVHPKEGLDCKHKLVWSIKIVATNPYFNADVDNVAKSVMDIVTKSQLVWDDDRDCVNLSIEKIAKKDTNRLSDPGYDIVIFYKIVKK